MTHEVFALPTAQEVVDSVVQGIVEYVQHQSAKGADVHVALTGGTSGTAINHALLSNETIRSTRSLHLWFSDERYVPRGHDERNDLNLEHLLDDCRAHVHHIKGPDETESPQESAQLYASELHLATTTRFCADNTLMDITILGLGPDGHVASLFPHAETLAATNAVTAVTDSPKPPSVRVTWTYPTINASRQVWIVATGSAKAQAVQLLLTEHGDTEQAIAQTPACGVQGKFETRVYVDFDAKN